MNINFLGKLLFTLSLILFIKLPTYASACNTEIPKKINFDKGAICWSYKGKGTSFSGRFTGGQNMRVSLTGWDGSSWERGDPWVSGPGGFSMGSNVSGELSFVTPQSGNYTIAVGPCYFWGSTVQITVCAS